jgi:outer membrane protein OmpA-like peptidoglycan-associated protein
MDTTFGMTAESYRSFNRWNWIIGLILAALLFILPWFFGIGPSSWRSCVPQTTPVAVAPPVIAPAPAPAPPAAPKVEAPPPPPPVAAAPAPEPTKPVIAVVADPIPSARVYFALDKFGLPRDVNSTLAQVIAYLKANPRAKALVSGFHDPQGKVTVAYNQELAQNRARAVRGALQLAGIPLDRIVMNKPQETTGTGSHEEARRVEVSIQP